MNGPDLLTKLSRDLIAAIALFLKPHEVQRLCFTCKSIEGEEGLGAYWYDHGTGKDKPYIQGAHKDYMQPAEFIIDCKLKKVILCAYSDGGLGRMDAGDVVGVISGIEKRRDEFPHVWSW